MKRALAISILFAFVFLIGGMPASAAAPTGFTSATYSDADNNGTVDTLTVIINGGEALTACTVDATELASDWAYVGNDIGGSIASASCNTGAATITFTLTGANAGVTGHSTAPTIEYNNTDADNSIANASGNLGAVAAANATDGAKPIIKTVTIEDTDNDGNIDKLTYTWSENIDTDDGAAPVAADLPTTLLPDGQTATFGSATISDPAGASAAVVVTAVGGQATENTAAGSTAISGDLSAKWVDGATNTPHATGATGNETVTDLAKPVVLTKTPNDPAPTSDPNNDNPVVITFSEAMTTGSLTFDTLVSSVSTGGYVHPDLV